MSLLERQLAASVAEAQRRKRDDIETWLDVTPLPPKRLQRKRMTQSEAIVIHRDVSGPLEFTPDQRKMIRDTFANGAEEGEFQVLMEVAKLRRLNPLLKQIHFVKRWSKDGNGGRGGFLWAAQVSVDGLRAIAERTGKYDGQDEAEYGPVVNGFPEFARVKVYRKDWARPAVGTAYWSEYVQKTKDGSVTRFWREMPRVMLAKCAESIAMRKAFPEDMGGLYTDEEMQQADNAPGGPVALRDVIRDELHLHAHITPGQDPDALPADGGALGEEIAAKLGKVKAAFARCDTLDKALALRAIIGSRAQQSELMRKRQAGEECGDISPAQAREIDKLWHHCDRQVAKLETQLKSPPLEASFQDEPDGTEVLGRERQPGEDD